MNTSGNTKRDGVRRLFSLLPSKRAGAAPDLFIGGGLPQLGQGADAAVLLEGGLHLRRQRVEILVDGGVVVQQVGQRLSELPPVTVYEPEYVPKPPVIDTTEPLHIEREDNTWLVEGPWLQRLMGNINFSDYESRMYFDKMLRQSGLFDTLEDMGIQDGDIVSMYDLEFEYQR